jgi:hypothetical protein
LAEHTLICPGDRVEVCVGDLQNRAAVELIVRQLGAEIVGGAGDVYVADEWTAEHDPGVVAARARGARLPSETESEAAAQWQDGAPSDRNRANVGQASFDTAPVGAYPGGAADCGALDLIGNLWEWTASEFDGYPGFSPHPYPEYSQVFFRKGYKVLRGGSWATDGRVASPSFRNWDLPQRRQIFSGVRLARGGAQ